MARRLYVGSLSYDTTEEGLREAFSKAGSVESAAIITDRDTGRAKGFGFVEMATDEEAQKAVQMLNETTLDGRTIIVNEARPRVERGGGGGGNRGGDRGRRGGGGGYGGGGYGRR